MLTVVGFDVSLSSAMSSGTKIPFNRIRTNIGGGWSNTSHTFTAPTDGLYYFTLGIMTTYSSSPYYAQARIMRGNVIQRYVLTQKGFSTNGNQAATGSVLIKLNRGQQVHAEHAGGTLYSDGGGLYTHFVGFLIQKVK